MRKRTGERWAKLPDQGQGQARKGAPLHISHQPPSQLGQTTGADQTSRDEEANRILMMLKPSKDQWRDHLTVWELGFMTDMHARWCDGGRINVSGKQIFRLRDIKDKLIELGVV